MDIEQLKRLAAQAKLMAERNTILRKIAANVPARVWIEAKEKAGYGTAITTAELSDPGVDEAWLEFVAAGPSSAPLPSFDITINGQSQTVHDVVITYEQVVELAFGTPDPDFVFSVTWAHKNCGGILSKGDRVAAQNGMRISAYNTSNA